MIIISSIKRVYKMVGHGSPAVRSRSKSRRGVVITLEKRQLDAEQSHLGPRCVPVDISHIEDFTKLAGHLGIRPDEFGLDTSLAEVGAHSEVRDGSNHGNGGSDIVEDSMWARLGEGQACE